MKKKDEQWHERMYRLFGDEDIGFEHSTRLLTFQVTEACSLACTYCYETHKEFSHKMPFEVAKAVID
jgi:sulfatase maturation enzyme AslB (radical SAM superfamily)